MKILKIAKLEVSILFYSPVAWLVLVIFLFQNGLSMFNMFGSIQEAASMGEQMGDITNFIFSGTLGLFIKILDTVYLYIPLLSMGIMSRELSSGSIKLLLSSPVKIHEIILGKYLALVAYGFLLVLILAGFGMVATFIIGKADVTLIISGLLGIFLLICTYAAIGLFMSSLTAYQVVAAISTLAVFAALRFVGGVGQEVNFIRDITYFLSITGRADDMIKGLLATKDIAYFLLIITLFLSLCIFRLQAGRETKRWTIQSGKYVLLICSILFAGYITSRPYFTRYLDMTQTKALTLTKNSQQVAGELKGELEIITYVNLLDQTVYSGLPVSRNTDLAFFDAYRRFIPGLKMNYVYYYDATDLKNNQNMVYHGDINGLSIKQLAQKVANNLSLNLNDFMAPAQIHQLINLRPEGNKFVRRLTYNGKSAWLRLFNDFNRVPEEAEITAAIKRLTVNSPKVVFLTGDNERSIVKTGDRNYSMLTIEKSRRKALVNQGFDVVSVDLLTQAIPPDAAVLVIADPTTPFSTATSQKVLKYIQDGGNLLIAGEPGRQSLLNPLLKTIGVQMLEGTLVIPSKDNAADLVAGTLTVSGEKLFEGRLPGGLPVTMQSSAALSYINSAGFKVQTLIKSPSSGWNKMGELDITSTDIKFETAAGDQPGISPMALALTRKINNHLQKIIVAGDADFISNAELAKDRTYNSLFATRLFSWFGDNQFPVDVHRQPKPDDTLLIGRRSMAYIKLVCMYVVPLLIVVLGAFVLISRKRK